ncbi:hypothetical protein FOLKNPGA_00308 [Legionella sp. PC1000]|uniref:hypothetical protein n=1 Tax=Legionella sp. PC1000 TaxID=2746060 RepID=UPI0015F95E6C|nr:hypothetical protein [Legionella sp. PC1000]QLZ67536.1 hypothetical protein FOLKNPGA_00308 [Legionella sp. PC1000]
MKRMLQGLVACFTLLMTAASLYAAPQPKFTLIPTTATTVQVPANGAATLQYQVSNQTKITRTLTIVPLPGVFQTSTQAGSCPNPFILAPKQSCLLTLTILGPQLPPAGIHGGPVVCKTKGPGDNSPDPFLCSQPSPSNQLNITRVSPALANLAVNPSVLTLMAGSGIPGVIQITNTSTTITAFNVHALLPPTWTDVIQDASNCVSIAPGASCQLRVTPGTIPRPQSTVFIQGDNTIQASILLSVAPPPSATITVTGSPLILIKNGSTLGLTVTNTSTNVTAINVRALLPATWNDVIQDASNCANIAPGASCLLRFTPSGTAHPQITVPVQGSNTNTVPVLIAVKTLLAYIANDFASGTNQVTRCEVGINGDFLNCLNAGGFNNPFDLVINPAGTLIYITNATGNNITKCEFDSIGGLVNCNQAGSGFNSPEGITLNAAGTFAYIANTASSSISKCQIDAAGNLSICNLTAVGATFIDPVDIIFNFAHTRAYVSNFGSGEITKCDVAINGELTCSPTPAGTGFNTPLGITLNQTETLAYIANQFGNFVSKCGVSSNGNLINCVNSQTINQPRYLVFHPTEPLVYITQAVNDTVSKCQVAANGDIINCTQTGSGMDGPTGIIFSLR